VLEIQLNVRSGYDKGLELGIQLRSAMDPFISEIDHLIGLDKNSSDFHERLLALALLCDRHDT